MIVWIKNILIVLILAVIGFTNITYAANYYEIGKNYYKKKNYLQAYSQFKKALADNPYNVNYRYYYAQTLVYLYRLEEAQKEYEKIIELAPLSEAAKLSSIAIVKIEKHLVGDEEDYTEVYETDPTIDGIGDNYIDNAQDNGKIVRWNLEKMPLKVWIDTSSQSEGFKPYYVTAIKEAFSNWIGGLDGLMNYALVSDPKQANITVKFVENISTKTDNKGGGSFISGLTSPLIKKNILNNIEIRFLSIKPNKQSFLEAEIHNTAMHEIGHALGIWGHSFDENDIMYPVAKQNEEMKKMTLSHRDINTIKLLYKLDADISNFDSDHIAKKDYDKNSLVLGSEDTRYDKKLKEAMDYVKKVPDHPMGWASLGSAYMDKKMYHDAVNSYKKALEVDSNYVQAKEGLAETYTKMGDYNNAVQEYKSLITTNPKSIKYSVNLVLLYKDKNKYNDAYNVLINLMKTNPEAEKSQNIRQLIQELNKEQQVSR